MSRRHRVVRSLCLVFCACTPAVRSPQVSPRADRVVVHDAAGKAGYIDRTGRVVIPPQFDLAFPFSDGLALVVRGDQFAYIDASGKVVLEGFDKAGSFSDGLALVLGPDHLWRFIDHAGKSVFVVGSSAEKDLCKGGYGVGGFAPADDFVDGRAVACKDHRWGVVDTRGTWVVEPRYQHVTLVSGGGAIVDDDGSLALVAPDGQVARPALTLDTDQAAASTDGLLPATNGEGRYGYLDLAGKIAIEPRFEYASAFHDGTAYVRVDDEASGAGRQDLVIDRTGKVIFEAPGLPNDPTEGIYTFSDACAAYDVHGAKLFELECSYLGRFREGLAAFGAPDGQTFGLVDRTGAVVVSPRFESVTEVEGGLACGVVAEVDTCVDLSGAVVYEAK